MNSKIFAPQEKVIANVDRALEIVKGNNPPPVLVEVDPSNACNHGCHFCISSYIHLPESKGLETYDRSIMPKKTLMKLCEDLADMGVRAVNWTGGGEPTINPALKDAINYLGPRNVKMGMFTNGTLLDKYELFTDLVSWMKWVRFSVDAGTMNTYNSIRRTSDGNNWNKMFVNLERLVKVRADFILFDRYMTHDKRVPFEPGQIIIGVGFVITPDNFVEVVDFAKVFKDIDVDYCQFKPEIVNLEREDGIQRDIEFWENRVMPLLEEAKVILGDKFQMNDYKLDDLQTGPPYGRTYKKCLGSQLQPCVGADGEVYVCTNLRGYKEYSYGNINERSFKEIWEDKDNRMRVMHRIEEEEKFKNCTQLCKPHESCKMMWALYTTYKALESVSQREMFEKYMTEQAMQRTREQLEHYEFI